MPAADVGARVTGAGRHAGALAVLAVVAGLGCAPAAAPPPPPAAIPPGLVVDADADVACAFLDAAAASETELARASAGAREVACACKTRVSAAADDGQWTSALSAFSCAPSAPGAASTRGGDVWWPAGDVGAAARAHATLALAANGDVIADVDDAPPALTGTALPLRLVDDGALAHVGVRTAPRALAGALDTPAMHRVLPDVAGFFGAALLDGTWEVAVYDGDAALPVVVRLGVRAPEQILAALSAAAKSRWHLESVPAQIAGRTGICVPDARMLPELAPCAVVDDGALVVGFHRAALAHALSSTTTTNAPATPAGGGIALDRFRGAGRMPWARIDVEPREHGVRLRFVKGGAP